MKYTLEMDNFLKEHETTPRKELTTLFNERFNLSMSIDQIAAKCLRMGLKTGRTGQLQKGHSTWNKGKSGYMGANATSFKKGQLPHNTRPDGSERICSKDGYTLIKVNGKFILKHRWIWEQHHGKIPKGYNVVFKDRDKTNFDIDNLILMSYAEMGVMNIKYSRYASAENNLSLLLMSKIRVESRK